MRNFTLVILVLFLINSQLFAQFGAPLEITNGANGANSVAVADIDGDGWDDILVSAHLDNTISWFRNLGDKSFTPEIVITNEAYGANSVLVEDLDNDGDLEVIYSSANDSTIAFYENLGKGVFSEVNIVSKGKVSSNNRRLRVKDMNNDGLFDFVVEGELEESHQWGAAFVIFTNLGNGSYEESEIHSFGYDNYRIVDLDKDGDLDILAASDVSGGVEGAVIYRNENGEFGDRVVLVDSIEEGIFDIETLDYDSDGDLDILLSGTSGVLVIGNDNDKFSLLPFPEYYTGGWNKYLEKTDLDQNGIDDIIAVTSSYFRLSIILNNSFYEDNYDTLKFGSDRMEFGDLDFSDLDHDGDIDIVGTSKNKVVWFENVDGKYFHHFNEITAGGSNASSIANGWDIKIDHGDLNGDGLEDVIILYNFEKKLAWVPNLGNGNFGIQKVILTEIERPIDLLVSDLDTDGDLDLLVGRYNGYLQAYVANDGNGNFSEEINFGPSLNSYNHNNFHSVDLNDDGLLDIVCFSSLGKTLSVRYNRGNGVYSSFISLQSGSNLTTNIYDVYSGDLDGDKDVDLLLHKRGIYDILFYENNGDETFEFVQFIKPDCGAVEGIGLADLNEDGVLDLIVGNTRDNELSLLRGKGDVSYFSKQTLIPDIEEWYEFDVLDFDNDNDLDIVISRDSVLVRYENDSSLFSVLDSTIDNFYTKPKFFDADKDGDLDAVYMGEYEVLFRRSYLNHHLSIEGKLFIDENNNDVYDGSDKGFSFGKVVSDPLNDFAFTNSQGDFKMKFHYGTNQTYKIYPQLPEHWEVTNSTKEYVFTLDTSLKEIDSINFKIQPTQLFDSVNASIIGGFPRCNSKVNYWLSAKNMGTTTLDGYVELKLDDSLQFVSSPVLPDSNFEQHLIWSLDSWEYMSQFKSKVTLEMPDFRSIGREMQSHLLVVVEDSSGMKDTISNDVIEQTLVCAYDPNDKQVEEGLDSLGYIFDDTEWLNYLIRFQNTGNDTAINVKIIDQLDDKLDWESLSVLSSSHEVLPAVSLLGEVRFSFDSIMLPDSNVDELNSHGFISFKVRLMDSLMSGNQIRNRASIYFDYNPAIITNQTINTIFECDSSFHYTNVNPSICLGDSVFAIAHDTIALTNFQWIVNNDTLFGERFNYKFDTAGDFELILKEENVLCKYDTIVNIKVHPLPSIELSDSFLIDSVCMNDTIVSLPYSNYEGGVFSGNSIVGDSLSVSLSELGLNVIEYYVTDSNSCTDTIEFEYFVIDCDTVVLDTTDTNQQSIIELIKASTDIYPTIAESSVFISFKNKLNGLIVLNIIRADGVLMERINVIDATKIELNIESYSKGLYMIQMVDEKNLLLQTKKFIKV